jgi:branched-chain amino acid transport system substrate-binding protein
MLVANAPEGITISNALLVSDTLKGKPVISHWGIAGGSFVKGLGLTKLSSFDISTIQTFSFLNAYDTERADRVLNAYRAKFDDTATKENIQGAVGLAQAYDLVHLLALAIKEANSTERRVIRDAFEAIEEHKGLVKHYKRPFTQEQHDALLRDDYFIAKFNTNGDIVPK